MTILMPKGKNSGNNSSLSSILDKETLRKLQIFRNIREGIEKKAEVKK